MTQSIVLKRPRSNNEPSSKKHYQHPNYVMYISFLLEEAGLFGEIADSRSVTENIQDELEHLISENKEATRN